MARADQLKALIRSHAEGDDSRFYAIALQMAAEAARSGKGRLAIELRELIDRTRKSNDRTKRAARPVPVVQPRGELSGLLTAAYPKTRLGDMVLADKIQVRLERTVREQRQRDRILERGLKPLRKLLLVGPPGTGKTMTASALAGELDLPLFTIQLDGLITKFLGETAAKLRLVFEAIQETRGVYLFDEFDALGGDRAARNDVGEIRRVLNSFLQFVEQDDSDSLVLASTNHPGLLDRALFRRFDAVIDYALPTREVADAVMRSRLSLFHSTRIDWNSTAQAAEGLSHADIVRACEQAAKNAILDEKEMLDTQDLLSALDERRSARG